MDGYGCVKCNYIISDIVYTRDGESYHVWRQLIYWLVPVVASFVYIKVWKYLIIQQNTSSCS